MRSPCQRELSIVSQAPTRWKLSSAMCLLYALKWILPNGSFPPKAAISFSPVRGSSPVNFRMTVE